MEINAIEMNKLASSKQIDKIEEAIKMRAENGKTYLIISYAITEITKEHFEAKKFKVSSASYMGLHETTIRWQNVQPPSRVRLLSTRGPHRILQPKSDG